MEIEAGRVLSGRYRLIRPLGQGSQASVWLAEHLALTTQVAVKLIDPDLAKREDARERFRREATAAATLRSAHVVQILDHGIDGLQPFIVMELLDGEDLFERLDKRGRLTLRETSRIVTQVARALSRAHAAGIIHRDLKPENVFLVTNEDDEVVKVFDFGVAKVTNPNQAVLQQTSVGQLIGTPHYMSPEQVKGTGEVDFRADLWALGIITYQCVTGHLPFDSEGVGDLLIKITLGELPIPSKVLPGLPPAFDAWFAKACHREPAQRFDSARELAEALARAVRGSPDAPGVASIPRPVTRGAVPPTRSVPPPAAFEQSGRQVVPLPPGAPKRPDASSAVPPPAEPLSVKPPEKKAPPVAAPRHAPVESVGADDFADDLEELDEEPEAIPPPVASRPPLPERAKPPSPPSSSASRPPAPPPSVGSSGSSGAPSVRSGTPAPELHAEPRAVQAEAPAHVESAPPPSPPPAEPPMAQAAGAFVPQGAGAFVPQGAGAFETPAAPPPLAPVIDMSAGGAGAVQTAPAAAPAAVSAPALAPVATPVPAAAFAPAAEPVSAPAAAFAPAPVAPPQPAPAAPAQPAPIGQPWPPPIVAGPPSSVPAFGRSDHLVIDNPPEFDGTRRKRLVRVLTVALIAAAVLIVWIVVSSQLPPSTASPEGSASAPPVVEPPPKPPELVIDASVDPIKPAQTASAKPTAKPPKGGKPAPRKQPKADDMTIEIPDVPPE
jgi:serine/threonine-protein kinase